MWVSLVWTNSVWNRSYVKIKPEQNHDIHMIKNFKNYHCLLFFIAVAHFRHFSHNPLYLQNSVHSTLLFSHLHCLGHFDLHPDLMYNILIFIAASVWSRRSVTFISPTNFAWTCMTCCFAEYTSCSWMIKKQQYKWN